MSETSETRITITYCSWLLPGGHSTTSAQGFYLPGEGARRAVRKYGEMLERLADS